MSIARPGARILANPVLYRISLGMTSMALLNALGRLARARTARARVVSILMAAAMAIELAGMVRYRPRARD
jgi:hypothetical protein